METAQQLQQILWSVEPAAHLVEPRVLRRVIRMDRNLQGLRLLIPHSFSYTIERDRLLTFVDLSELEIAPGSDLPRLLILLPRPEDDPRHPRDLAALAARYHRMLFHAAVHMELENRVARKGLDSAWAELRRDQLGDVEFAEIREVLLKDDYLFPSPTDADVYIEFAALYLELRYFAPHEVRLHFPALRDWEAIDKVLQQDLDHFALFERLRLSPALLSDDLEATQEMPAASGKSARTSRSRMSLSQFRGKQAKAERASATGNSVKAALTHLRSSRRAPAGHEDEALAAAQMELKHLAGRLQAVLQLTPEETEQWSEALRPLLQPAADGFWTNEARLLYDLQKVCLEQERGVYRLDLVDWVKTLGQRPIRRPLPLMQEALTLRHLRTIRRRVTVARIDAAERSRLSILLNNVLPQVETRSRDRLRTIILEVFDKVGLVPQNVPEQVARRKVVEELLDRVVDRSYFSMSDLRDTLSKNNLKLPDVTTLSDLAFGDCLLRADRRFEAVLDGVYRPGAIYQRWPQTLSSLVFGTRPGRFLAQHLFIPFGGAYLTIMFLEHVAAWFTGTPHAPPVGQTGDAHVAAAAHAGPSYWLIAGVLLLGTWISLLIHQPAFREWNVTLLSRLWRLVTMLVIDVPTIVLNSEYMQRILASRAFRVLRDYVLEPAVCILIMWFPAWLMGYQWSRRFLVELYLGTALFLTSPVGRYTSELTIDFLMRAWHELKINVFSALIGWIIDLFDSLLVNLERLVYTVDEFLRFRAGDNPVLQAVKLAGGVVWFFVAYVVVFVFTLLVEPQINPIKHFPVVTVSHKVILPTGPMLVRELTPYLGKTQANTLVWTTIWLIPGVFGFLVWELKENWRLYAANRRPRLGCESIGLHGETMLQLLRPGFHSGTLPKAFAALRRESRKVKDVDANWVLRKWAAIVHVEESVRHFVERELLHLLEEASVTSPCNWTVLNVRAATNRIDVDLSDRLRPDQAARLTWEHDDATLVGSVRPSGLLAELPPDVLDYVVVAMSGLFQRAGVEVLQGPVPLQIDPNFPWTTWVQIWTPSKAIAFLPDARTETATVAIADVSEGAELGEPTA
ncbi:hypothetical protein [Planctomicrobium piriforme]|uniref:Uncharacterized protein n=1 Tax=Planctomicrobium piriforme TaxID=1576369 RepID=A0A1I3TCY5_9PLAN|nr:hypothetical protein [Planctomicrobium piriforme]SFJ68373.1 hypothetical protein SAMN05421753_12910 [Planctomicrobium piriforme]